jgi:chondroitin AC lyase
LEGNNSSVVEGVNAIGSVLVVLNTADEGIQVDQTFYQHSTQIYNGGYGLQLVLDVSKWIGILAGTSLEIDGTEKAVLDNLVIDGTGWMQWHGQIDYSTMGRNLARNTTGTASSSLGAAVQRLINGGSARLQELQALLAHLKGSSSAGVGQQHFWRSDYSVQRDANAMVSLHMFSKRTVGSEYGNGENALGAFQGYGTTYIYRTGKEYVGIFPVWNWNRLPGTTLEQLPSVPVPAGNTYVRGTQTFVGGVSDGQIGLSAFVQDEVTHTAKAHKSWFFFGNGYLAMGAGIRASGPGTVFSTINQCLLQGTVRAGQNGVATSVARGEADMDNVSWLLHDQVGYVFPAPTRVHLKNASQSGDWKTINHGYDSLVVTTDVFLAGLDHGVNPANASFAYFVLPAVDETATTSFANDCPVTILANTPAVQAARHRDGFSGIAFFSTGSVTLKPGLTVSSSAPVLLLVHELSTGLALEVADPTQLLTSVQIDVTGHYQGANASYDSASNTTHLVVTLPSGVFAGSTVEVILPNG